MKFAAAIGTIDKKEDYMTVLEALMGEKTEFTPEEAGKLLEIYQEDAKNKFGIADETLVKAVLALDVPGANLLDKADADALAVLAELCRDWTPGPEKISAVKAAAMAGGASQPMALAMARAALDAYACQSDIGPYREEIRALAGVVGQADEDSFAAACNFLVRVRERAR